MNIARNATMRHSLRWLIGLTLCLLTIFAQAEPVRILPLGDSDTTGHNHHASYRYPLYFLLTDAGFDVDFVGNSNTTYDGPNLDWYPRYVTEFDPDHQGMWGARSDELVSIGQIVAKQHQPHIVLFKGGGADIVQQGAGGVTNARFGITDMVEKIRSVAPGVTFILSLSNPYRENGGFGAQAARHVVPLNNMIRELGSTLDRPDSPVIVVDQYTGFDVDTMAQPDGVHQNRKGEEFLANNLFEVLSRILPEIEPEPFSINRGHAGAWFNALTSGQGLLIDIEEDGKFLFMSWFTYTPAGATETSQQHWLTAQGNYEGNRAVLELYETLGGRFDDPQAVKTSLAGEATLVFNDCGTGHLTFSIDNWNLEGSFDIERVIPGTGNVCLQLAGDTESPMEENDGWDGAWFDPETPGQGILLDVQTDSVEGDFLFASWFTFGDQTDSGQRWLTAQGDLAGSKADIAVFETTGGRFNDPESVATVAVGTMVVEFRDCSHAELSYDLDDGNSQGIIELTRVIPGSERLCEQIESFR